MAKSLSGLDKVALFTVGGAFVLGAFASSLPIRAIILKSIGRGEYCPAPEAWRAGRESRQQLNRGLELLKASRLQVTDPERFERWITPMGPFWIPQGNQGILPALLHEQETSLYGTGAGGVRPGDTVIDCGAHVGFFTRTALLKGAHRVIAVEPSPRNRECLRRNFQSEIAAGRVILDDHAVWNTEGMAEFDMDDQGEAGAAARVVQAKTYTSIVVPLTTVDNLVKRHKLDRVDFIKMDIEGAEPKALQGAAETIRTFKPRMAIATYHEPGDPTAVLDAVKVARADYATSCSVCKFKGTLNIVPVVYLFR